MDKLIEHNGNIHGPVYRPSLLENPKTKHYYVEVQTVEPKITSYMNHHYWLQTIFYK